MASKRKIDKEGREFNNDWKLSYFVKHHSVNQAVCVICNQIIAVLKEYNIQPHYTTRHAQQYDQHSGRERAEKYETLSKNLASQQRLFTRYTEISEKATKCSLVIANKIGQRQLPFQHGEFAKEVSLSLFHQYAEYYRFLFGYHLYVYYTCMHFMFYLNFISIFNST